MITFGAGKLIATPTTDATGAAVANPTPVAVAVLQDVSVDFDFETKTLYGNMQFPVAVGRGKGKVGWKAKSGDFNGALLGSLYFGQTAQPKRQGAVVDAPHAIPSATAYTVTVTPPASGVFGADLGVTDVTTGLPMQRVAATPEAGQYSVSNVGLYTFNVADKGKGVLISYEYTIATSPGSETFNLTNQLMGYAPVFSALFFNQYMGKTLVMKLNQNILGKLSRPMKNDDFTLTDMDADAFVDQTGSLGYICMY